MRLGGGMSWVLRIWSWVVAQHAGRRVYARVLHACLQLLECDLALARIIRHEEASRLHGSTVVLHVEGYRTASFGATTDVVELKTCAPGTYERPISMKAHICACIYIHEHVQICTFAVAAVVQGYNQQRPTHP